MDVVACVEASIRVTVLEPLFATHAALTLSAMAVGARPTETAERTVPLSGSTTATLFDGTRRAPRPPARVVPSATAVAATTAATMTAAAISPSSTFRLCPRPRVHLGQPGRSQSIDANRPVEVLQRQRAEVTEANPTEILLVGKQRPGRVGEQYLPAVGNSRDPGCPMDREPVITPVLQQRLACVQAHPNANGHSLRPVVLGQCTLRVDRRPHAVGGALEDEEERVSLRIDLHPTMPVDNLTHQTAV